MNVPPISIPIIALTVREDSTEKRDSGAVTLAKGAPAKQVGKRDIEGVFVVEKDNKVKFEPYECGIEPITGARERYSIRYYLVAMLFVIFDVETVFMFPWAVIFDKLLLFGLIEMVVFIFILVVGYYYAWQKGALDWV